MIPPLTKESRLYYGKAYRGQQIKNVPAGYLLWILENGPNLPVQLKQYIEANKEALLAEKKKVNKMLNR